MQDKLLVCTFATVAAVVVVGEGIVYVLIFLSDGMLLSTYMVGVWAGKHRKA